MIFRGTRSSVEQQTCKFIRSFHKHQLFPSHLLRKSLKIADATPLQLRGAGLCSSAEGFFFLITRMNHSHRALIADQAFQYVTAELILTLGPPPVEPSRSESLWGQLGFDSCSSYAASDQVMIHGPTWQHDGLFILFSFFFSPPPPLSPPAFG